MRMRKLKLKNGYANLVPIKKKSERRLMSREIRAEQVARLDTAIEKELIQRLKTKAYGEDMPLNIKQEVWEQILKENEVSDSDKSDEELDLEQQEEEEEEENEREFVSDISGDESDDFGDIEDFAGLGDKNYELEFEKV
ncbi:Protein mak16 [Smittium culicis]|uniref:Protein mak16 n=1 Tax=Smittium culicis TaxID=133412 RepID=A0A1R1X8B2_9FUNG|nr:Protein mak16 [Smittium culicis]